MFFTQFNTTKKPKSVAGSGIKDVYKSRYDKTGHLIVEKKGTENIYAKIQSFADSVDINLLIKRFLNGDLQALNRKKALYMDTTGMPENYFDAVNKVNDLKDLFKTLPTDVKEKFGNNPDLFIGSIGTDEWISKLKVNKMPSINELKEDHDYVNNHKEDFEIKDKKESEVK